MQQEAEAAAFAEISGNSNADTKSFEQMEADTKVDAELQRLMAEMGTSTSDADLDARLLHWNREVHYEQGKGFWKERTTQHVL